MSLGVLADRTKEILGLWPEQNEGAKFWLRVLNELKNRGVEDILLAVVDGLNWYSPASPGQAGCYAPNCGDSSRRQSRAHPD